MKIKGEHLAIGAVLIGGLLLVSSSKAKTHTGFRGHHRRHHGDGMQQAMLGRRIHPFDTGIQNNDRTERGGAASPMSGFIAHWSPITAKNANPLLAHTPTNRLLRTAPTGGLNAMHRLQGSYGLTVLRPDTIINYR